MKRMNIVMIIEIPEKDMLEKKNKKKKSKTPS